MSGKIIILKVAESEEYVVRSILENLNEEKEFSDFKVYPDYRKIYRGETEVILSRMEYELFLLLSDYPGVVFTKEQIFEALYSGEAPENLDNIIYCLVAGTRKKIEPDIKNCQYIKTVRGIGYKFEGKKTDIILNKKG